MKVYVLKYSTVGWVIALFILLLHFGESDIIVTGKGILIFILIVINHRILHSVCYRIFL